jgi:uncharacterized membrane protein
VLKLSRAGVALFFAVAGLNHFVAPAPYLAIIPPSLPWPLALVYISGAAEIVCGIGVLFARTRRLAAIGLLLLLIAVFPANIYAALAGMEIGGRAVPRWLLWLRLPLQLVFIAWVWSVSREKPNSARTTSSYSP